jgi:hypothetical protein
MTNTLTRTIAGKKIVALREIGQAEFEALSNNATLLFPEVENL